MKETTYRRIVSGKAEGWGPAAARGLLGILSLPYSAGIRVRNLLYDSKILPIHSASVPVISVGNLTTGGTGKTPLVIWLANILMKKGLRCAILTRGYKTRAGTLSDEPALLAKACDGAAVVVNPDRAAGAKKAVEKHHAQVLILDDGFQHRRLNRDLDLLAIDATCPFGFGKILPAGLLREPAGSIRRADAVVITRFDQASEQQIAHLEEAIRRIRPEMPIIRATHKLSEARTFQHRTLPTEELGDKKCFVFCGIGNPGAFLKSIEELGCSIAGKHIFDDHHSYTPQDLEMLIGQAKKLSAEVMLTTEKDWVKAALLADPKHEIPLLYLALELEFLTPPDTIVQKIDGLVNSISGKEPQ